ncbi:hypothetical protein [uncultured Erythrobacter sp.]|uniref:hypothetical protein n=1 Tax=uncultured Erythrobacter sp. TaxID=263913 RepID=UPI002603E7AB|nr:hypothetical protein [uncultured Erythrobacter sp.]
MRKVVLASLLAGILTTQANAATHWCTGGVEAFYVNHTGAAIFKPTWSPVYLQICNVEVEWKGITTSTCMAWVAKVDAAIGLTKQIRIRYASVNGCDQIAANGSAPAPYYLMLLP